VNTIHRYIAVRAALCALVLPVLAIEVAATLMLREKAAGSRRNAAGCVQSQNALGPASAQTAELEACVRLLETSRGDPDPSEPDSLRRAALALDLAERFRRSGMPSGDAETSAELAASSPALASLALGVPDCGAATIAGIEAVSETAARWRVRISCEKGSLPAILELLAQPLHGARLSGISLKRQQADTIGIDVLIAADGKEFRP